MAAEFLQSTPDVALVIFRGGKIMEVHAPDESLLVAAADTLVGRYVVDLLPEALAATVLGRVAETLETGRQTSLHYQLMNRRGEHLTQCHGRCVPYGDSGFKTASK